MLEHPALECPWCRDARLERARQELELDPEADPVGTIRAVLAELESAKVRRRELDALAGRAARVILAGDDVNGQAAACGVKVARLDRWARPPAPAACAAGHLRSEHGVWDAAYHRWRCELCPTGAAAHKRKAAPNRKDRRTMAAAVERARRQIEERRALVEVDEPARVLEPMPPPESAQEPPRRRIG